MTWWLKLLLTYLGVLSVLTIIITVYDKLSAKAGKWRIPEATLLLTGLFGGAFAEFVTMQIIRHKTQHRKFMILLPLEIVLHVALLVVALYFAFK
ncbi:MAG: DUF1294 domain-containing protein [Clostridia bacterium]|nr:DUF1294 domain-containing protein [Clostridia bacterium]